MLHLKRPRWKCAHGYLSVVIGGSPSKKGSNPRGGFPINETPCVNISVLRLDCTSPRRKSRKSKNGLCQRIALLPCSLAAYHHRLHCGSHNALSPESE